MSGLLYLARTLGWKRPVIALVAASCAFACSPALSQSGRATYTYDALGRIASARYDAGFIIVYTYDANGNRLSQTIDVNSNAMAWTPAVPPCTSNCWGAAAWNSSLTWTPTVPPCTTDCWGNALWKN